MNVLKNYIIPMKAKILNRKAFEDWFLMKYVQIFLHYLNIENVLKKIKFQNHSHKQYLKKLYQNFHLTLLKVKKLF